MFFLLVAKETMYLPVIRDGALYIVFPKTCCPFKRSLAVTVTCFPMRVW